MSVNNGGGTYASVMSNDRRVMVNLLRSLLAVGCDDFLAVLDDVDVDHGFAHGPLLFSWGANRHFLAHFFRNAGADGSRFDETSVVTGFTFSFGLSLTFFEQASHGYMQNFGYN